MAPLTYILRIFRGTPGHQYWEEFELKIEPMANVVSGLLEIQRHPVTREGKRTTPISYESGCLEEVCGSCSVLVNGRPRQACTALIANYLEQTHSRTITVAPLTKFPLIRDLVVDRSVMFDNLIKVHGWIDAGTTHDKGPGPTIDPAVQEERYALSTCMTCGCCSESCPQVNSHSAFMGPAPISQVRYLDDHPTGKLQEGKRLGALLQEGGIADCGNAQNCVQVCPKHIPLTESIALMGRSATRQSMRDLFSLPDAKGSQ
ncbi:MAG: succinate dehydrogenase iron-sulfur subunit [Chlamydiia bacterium]